MRGLDLDALIEALRHPDWRARRAAARELGGLGDRRAVPHLLEALRDEN